MDTTDTTKGTTLVQSTRKSKIAQLLQDIDRGTVEDELSDVYVNLIEKLRQIGDSQGGKPTGAITLKVKFRYDRGLMDVDATVAVSEPRPIRGRCIMYPAREGGLSKDHQNQMDAFRDIPEATPIRDITALVRG